MFSIAISGRGIEIVKIAKFLYFGFECVTNDIEGWLKFCVQIWFIAQEDVAKSSWGLCAILSQNCATKTFLQNNVVKLWKLTEKEKEN
jgi:hypothetical protein